MFRLPNARVRLNVVACSIKRFGWTTTSAVALLATTTLGCGGSEGLVEGAAVGESGATEQPAPAGNGALPDRNGSSPAPRPVRNTAPAPAMPHGKAIELGRAAFEGNLKPDEKRLAATVVVTGVGEAAGTSAFLYEQLRKAASQFYSEETAGSRARPKQTRSGPPRPPCATAGSLSVPSGTTMNWPMRRSAAPG